MPCIPVSFPLKATSSVYRRIQLTHKIEGSPLGEIFLRYVADVADLQDFRMISLAAFDGVLVDLGSHVLLHI